MGMENCYKAYPQNKTTYAEAQSFCHDDAGGGGRIARPTTNILRQFLNVLVRKAEVAYGDKYSTNVSEAIYWLGFNVEVDATENYFDLFTTPVTGKDCVRMEKTVNDTQLVLTNCSEALYAPICQRREENKRHS